MTSRLQIVAALTLPLLVSGCDLLLETCPVSARPT